MIVLVKKENEMKAVERLNRDSYKVEDEKTNDGEDMIGTAALKKLDSGRCELKALYLLEKYHKKGLGRRLLNTVLQKARQDGYGEIYLDTLSSSRRAVCLYEKAGFERTERYNENYTADIFMVLKLSEAGGSLS